MPARVRKFSCTVSFSCPCTVAQMAPCNFFGTSCPHCGIGCERCFLGLPSAGCAMAAMGRPLPPQAQIATSAANLNVFGSFKSLAKWRPLLQHPPPPHRGLQSLALLYPRAFPFDPTAPNRRFARAQQGSTGWEAPTWPCRWWPGTVPSPPSIGRNPVLGTGGRPGDDHKGGGGASAVLARMNTKTLTSLPKPLPEVSPGGKPPAPGLPPLTRRTPPHSRPCLPARAAGVRAGMDEDDAVAAQLGATDSRKLSGTQEKYKVRGRSERC